VPSTPSRHHGLARGRSDGADRPEQAGVACLAGTAFGAIGEGHLRLSYANSLENLELAVQRISEWAKASRTAAVRA
jgi:bifunctional pyridoxal-dependent enzyme with beta-cystathionase and maltose regulon repressor activities